MKDELKLIQDTYTSIQLVEEAIFGIKQGYELLNAGYVGKEDSKVITDVESTKLNHAVMLLNERVEQLLDKTKER